MGGCCSIFSLVLCSGSCSIGTSVCVSSDADLTWLLVAGFLAGWVPRVVSDLLLLEVGMDVLAGVVVRAACVTPSGTPAGVGGAVCASGMSVSVVSRASGCALVVELCAGTFSFVGLESLGYANRSHSSEGESEGC